MVIWIAVAITIAITLLVLYIWVTRGILVGVTWLFIAFFVDILYKTLMLVTWFVWVTIAFTWVTITPTVIWIKSLPPAINYTFLLLIIIRLWWTALLLLNVFIRVYLVVSIILPCENHRRLPGLDSIAWHYLAWTCLVRIWRGLMLSTSYALVFITWHYIVWASLVWIYWRFKQ